MRHQTVLLDANVLYSKTLRDWICLTALENPGFFQVRWTESILAEWQYHLRRSNPLRSEDWITRYPALFRRSFPEGCVEGFAVEKPDWLVDLHDAHVHSAAAAAQVAYLVTDDGDWSNAPLDELSYEVHTADSFLSMCALSQSRPLGERTAQQLAYAWRRRRNDEIDIVGPLKRAGANDFAEHVRALCQEGWVQSRFEELIDSEDN